MKKTVKIKLYNGFEYNNKLEQIDKIKEEFDELLEAIFHDNKESILEEAFDLIQSTYGLIKIISGKEIEKVNEKHITKLKKREKD